MSERYRPISPFAKAFAAEYKGFMRANGVTNLQIAQVLGRNDGYVSERANGKRPLDMDDIDVLAGLVSGWDGQQLMLELARRAQASTDAATSTDDYALAASDDDDWQRRQEEENA